MSYSDDDLGNAVYEAVAAAFWTDLWDNLWMSTYSWTALSASHQNACRALGRDIAVRTGISCADDDMGEIVFEVIVPELDNKLSGLSAYHGWNDLHEYHKLACRALGRDIAVRTGIEVA